MRLGTTTLKQVLQGSFNSQYVCDVFVEGIRVYQDLPVTNVQINEDSTAQVQTTGSLRVAYQDTFGASVVPVSIGDAFSPFGSQIVLYALVTAGVGFAEKIRLGSFFLSQTPQILAQWFLFQGTVLSKGDVIDIDFADLFYRTNLNQFDSPAAPLQLASVWTEYQRILGIPVTYSVADAAIPATFAYAQSRLQGAYDLATVLDATACVLSDGTASMRPNVWPAVMDTINGGDGGTLLSSPRAMQNTNVANELVVQDSSGNVLASAQVTSGPLRVANPDGSLSPYGLTPQFYTNPQITTQAQAQAYANLNIARVSSLRGMQVAVSETFNPLRELGDVVTVNRKASGVVTESFTGRVTAINRSGNTAQSLTLAVGQ